MSDQSPAGFSLSELIKSTAEELQILRDNPPKKPVMFLDKCELEVAVTVNETDDGRLNFKVVEFGNEKSSQTVSRVKLCFMATGELVAQAHDVDI